MLKKIVSVALISIVIIGLNGCSGGPKPKQNKQINGLSISDRTTILKINFPEIDPLTGKKLIFNVNEYDFSNQISTLSKYKKFHEVERYGKISHRKGLYVYKQANQYILNYSNGEYYYNEDVFWATDVDFTIHYKQLNNNQVSFILNNKYIYKPANDITGDEYKPLDSLQNLENGSKNILSKLNTLKIVLHKRYHFTGDINSKYKADSIYANFKRLAGTYNWHSYYGNQNDEKLTEVKKENTFNLKVNGELIPLHVEVYPYRNGSKVQYEAYIPYTIDSSNGDASLNASDVKKLRTEIFNIIND